MGREIVLIMASILLVAASCVTETAEPQSEMQTNEGRDININEFTVDNVKLNNCTPGRKTVLCTMLLNYSKMNESDCFSLLPGTERDLCFSRIAMARPKLLLCNEIREMDPARYRCITDIAAALNNITLCENIEPVFWKDLCLLKVGVGIDDRGVCDMIVNETPKSSCLRDVSIKQKDAELCHSIPLPGERDFCFWAVADKTMELQTCGLIEHKQLRESCIVDIGAPVN